MAMREASEDSNQRPVPHPERSLPVDDSGATHPKGQGVVGIKVVLRDLSVGLQGTWGVDGEAIRCRYLGPMH